MAGLAEAVSLLAAKVQGITTPGLSDEVPHSAVAAALVVLSAAFLAELLPSDQGARLLNDLGIAAASDGGIPNGKDTTP
jgi:hypothetical protein